MIVYLITNTVNGKKYVGQHKHNDLEKYWQHNVRKASSRPKDKPALYAAIRKYGPDAFTAEVLFTCDNKKTLDLYEKGHIRFFSSRKNGYNLTDGGDGNHGLIVSEETRQKIGAFSRTRKHSEETRRLIGESQPNAKKTSCASGHAFDEENTYMWKGRRKCRTCNKEGLKRLRLRQGITPRHFRRAS